MLTIFPYNIYATVDERHLNHIIIVSDINLKLVKLLSVKVSTHGKYFQHKSHTKNKTLSTLFTRQKCMMLSQATQQN